MTIRILINGAAGKMGQASVKAISNHPDLVLVGETGRNHNLANEIKNNKPDVVVDFTNAEAAAKNAEIIIDGGAHPVIGTSGLTQQQIQPLQERCKQLKLGGVIAPNFSIGAILTMKYAQEFVKYFPNVEVIEMHHDGKLDSPSGTAIRTAELLAHARQQLPNKKTNKEIIPHARGASYQDIPIHALRLPGIIAEQQIIFGGLGETVTLKHSTLDRQCFMPGVILACQKVVHLTELAYGLEHLLEGGPYLA